MTLDDINEAHTKLHDSQNRWFEIGQALHVDDVTLDSIRKQCANDDSNCLREMLAHRLKVGPPLTWKELFNSIENLQLTQLEPEGLRTQSGMAGNIFTFNVVCVCLILKRNGSTYRGML